MGSTNRLGTRKIQNVGHRKFILKIVDTFCTVYCLYVVILFIEYHSSLKLISRTLLRDFTEVLIPIFQYITAACISLQKTYQCAHLPTAHNKK